MPGGVWTSGDVLNPATRPGAYFNLVAAAISLIGEGEAGSVGIVGRADWGPLDEFVELTTEASIVSTFGEGLSLAKLGRQAIRGGAGRVKLMRIAGSSSAVADVDLNDNDSPGTAALTVTAKYAGSRGNTLRVTVAANPIEGVDLHIHEGSTLLETFTTDTGTNTQFAAEINSRSAFVTATATGAADRVLDLVSQIPLAGGDSGGTVLAGDYTSAQAIAIQEDFDVFVQDDEDDPAIQDSLAAWAADARAEGNRFHTVMGSAAAASLATAIARAADMDNEGIVFVHPGFTDVDGVVYTGQEAAARVAGLIAAAGISRSITFNKITDGADVETRLTNSEIGQALAGGLTTLVFDGEVVRVEKGINTLTTITDDKPLAYSRIRTISVLDAVQDGMHVGLRELVGQVNNDDDGRATILGAAQSFLDTLVQARALKPGAFVELDPEFEQEGESVFLRVAVTPLDSIEKIFVTVYVSAA